MFSEVVGSNLTECLKIKKIVLNQNLLFLNSHSLSSQMTTSPLLKRTQSLSLSGHSQIITEVEGKLLKVFILKKLSHYNCPQVMM